RRQNTQQLLLPHLGSPHIPASRDAALATYPFACAEFSPARIGARSRRYCILGFELKASSQILSRSRLRCPRQTCLSGNYLNRGRVNSLHHVASASGPAKAVRDVLAKYNRVARNVRDHAVEQRIIFTQEIRPISGVLHYGDHSTGRVDNALQLDLIDYQASFTGVAAAPR